MRFTIKAKLASAFGAIIVLSAITGTLAYVKLSESVETSTDLVQRAARIDKAGELQNNILNRRRRNGSFRENFEQLVDVVGNFNGDGFPDLAVGNSGGVVILLNAADWGGGHAAPPSRRPPVHFTHLGEAPPELVFASIITTRYEAQSLPSSISADHEFNPAWPWPMQTASGQPAYAEANFPQRAPLKARHTQDAVFDRWGDPLVDLPIGFAILE